ncbi:hypothetical protein A2U01_0012978 [Trifolium medium]|uniref:Uncharacterized protein n=1 Tax=Trifolium medium TaxID=97028 RepID=A0A392MWX3_9FABA|nr:hypothetical protein [Trifolium medium]
MTAIWEDFPEECKKNLEASIEACKTHNAPIEHAIEIYHEFIRRPRRHLSIFEAWIEFDEEKDLEAQRGESTKSLTTQIELDSKGNKGKDFEADEEVVKAIEEVVQEKNEKSSLPKENTKDVETFMQTEKRLKESSPQEEQLQKKPQKKREDPRSLPITCSIGEVNIEGALCDLDSNINLMPLYLADRLEEAHPEEEDKEEDQEKQLGKIEMNRRDVIEKPEAMKETSGMKISIGELNPNQ